MPITSFNPRIAYLVTKTIYFSLITCVVLFLVITLVMIGSSTYFKLDFNDPVFLVAIFLTLATIPAGFIFSNRTAQFNPADPLNRKFPAYQTRLITRIATCEGPGLFAIVGLLISNNLAFLIFLAVSLFVIILYYPSPARIGQELELTQGEIDSLSH